MGEWLYSETGQHAADFLFTLFIWSKQKYKISPDRYLVFQAGVVLIKEKAEISASSHRDNFTLPVKLDMCARGERLIPERQIPLYLKCLPAFVMVSLFQTTFLPDL